MCRVWVSGRELAGALEGFLSGLHKVEGLGLEV